MGRGVNGRRSQAVARQSLGACWGLCWVHGAGEVGSKPRLWEPSRALKCQLLRGTRWTLWGRGSWVWGLVWVLGSLALSELSALCPPFPAKLT